MPRSEAGLPFIAATASPRRRELLSRFWPQGNIIFQVPEFQEDLGVGKGAEPADAVRMLTAGKMDALCAQFDLPDDFLAMTADTLVFCDGAIFGKPADEAQAKEMLRSLSGREHSVITGLCLHVRLHDKVERLESSEVTRVFFAPLCEKQITWYIGTGEPFDKAGAYGIQGCGAVLVQRIEGCYYNVMGLPVHRLMCLLQQA